MTILGNNYDTQFCREIGQLRWSVSSLIGPKIQDPSANDPQNLDLDVACVTILTLDLLALFGIVARPTNRRIHVEISMSFQIGYMLFLTSLWSRCSRAPTTNTRRFLRPLLWTPCERSSWWRWLAPPTAVRYRRAKSTSPPQPWPNPCTHLGPDCAEFRSLGWRCLSRTPSR